MEVSLFSLPLYKNSREYSLVDQNQDALKIIINEKHDSTARCSNFGGCDMPITSTGKRGCRLRNENMWSRWTPQYDLKSQETKYERTINIKIPSITSNLVPNFQNCFFSRFYELEFRIELRSQTPVPSLGLIEKSLKSITDYSTNYDNNRNNASTEPAINYNFFSSNSSETNSYQFTLNVPLDIVLKLYVHASTEPELFTNGARDESPRSEKIEWDFLKKRNL